MAKYSYYNPQPYGKSVGDCAIRALSKALGQTWEQTYTGLALQGFLRGDLPNCDQVWGKYLYDRGFQRHFIPDDGVGAYTVSDFTSDHPHGIYVLSMPGQHVLTVVDGKYFDSWDSGMETPSYYFSKEK